MLERNIARLYGGCASKETDDKPQGQMITSFTMEKRRNVLIGTYTLCFILQMISDSNEEICIILTRDLTAPKCIY